MGRVMPSWLRHQLTCVLRFGGCSGTQCIPKSGPTQERAVNRPSSGPSRWRGLSGLPSLVNGEQSGRKGVVNIIGSTRRRLSGPGCRLAIGGLPGAGSMTSTTSGTLKRQGRLGSRPPNELVSKLASAGLELNSSRPTGAVVGGEEEPSREELERMASELDLLLLHAKLAKTVGYNYEFRLGIAKVLDRSRWREDLIGLLWAWSRGTRAWRRR